MNTNLKMVSDYIILAAGFGSRARPLTDFIPKPLLPMGEGVVLDYAIEYAIAMGMTPHIVVGHEADRVITYLKERGVPVHIHVEQEPSANLLCSLSIAKKFTTSQHFIWSGAAMFFSEIDSLFSLLEFHEAKTPFCSLFVQTSTVYKPKIVIRQGKVQNFIVAETGSPVSSPTWFCVNRSFFDYAESLPETDVFQTAINDGLTFEATELKSTSIEIHTLHDYLTASRMMLGPNYVDDHSVASGARLEDAYIYSSDVSQSDLKNVIVIDSEIRDQCVANAIVYENEMISLPRDLQLQ